MLLFLLSIAQAATLDGHIQTSLPYAEVRASSEQLAEWSLPVDEAGWFRVNWLEPGRYELALVSGPSRCDLGSVQVWDHTEISIEDCALRVVAPAASPRVVTNGQLRAWLADNPAWLPAPAIERGDADGGYLQGWPLDPSLNGAPATRVPWIVAARLCQDYGGLATGSYPLIQSGLSAEWRLDLGAPAGRLPDGRIVEETRPHTSSPGIGFRCVQGIPTPAVAEQAADPAPDSPEAPSPE